MNTAVDYRNPSKLHLEIICDMTQDEEAVKPVRFFHHPEKENHILLHSIKEVENRTPGHLNIQGTEKIPADKSPTGFPCIRDVSVIYNTDTRRLVSVIRKLV